MYNFAHKFKKFKSVSASHLAGVSVARLVICFMLSLVCFALLIRPTGQKILTVYSCDWFYAPLDAGCTTADEVVRVGAVDAVWRLPRLRAPLRVAGAGTAGFEVRVRVRG